MILTDPAIQAKFGRKLRLRALAAFLADTGRAAKLRGRVAVLLTDDSDLRRLNRQFRRKDKPTDVLSFPPPPNAAAPSSARLAGDLAVSVETAAAQAAEAGHPLFVELKILILHGVLHLAGYDHETDSGQMARREAALRRRFGLAPGLIERAARPTPASTAAGKRRS